VPLKHAQLTLLSDTGIMASATPTTFQGRQHTPLPPPFLIMSMGVLPFSLLKAPLGPQIRQQWEDLHDQAHRLWESDQRTANTASMSTTRSSRQFQPADGPIPPQPAAVVCSPGR
jgi:hypothetical protein